MSKLSQLAGKGKKMKIGEIELEIKPLSVSDMDLMMNLGKEGSQEQIESMRTLVTKVLKDSVPDATDEEIKNVSIEHLQKIMEGIMEVNQLEGVNTDDKQFLENMKKRQADVRRAAEAGHKKG